jgi:Rrf2 family transcriptional regulator, iron-sulfur cluster assembly transcription factor
MLSQTAEYAFRAVLHIAEAEDTHGRMPVARIARELGVPQNYLSKILHTLARQGVLDSSRGPGGGFGLAIRAEELTLARVVNPFDRLGERQQCLLGRERCSDASPCRAHDQWKTIAAQVRDFFTGTTVAALLDQTPSGRGGRAGAAMERIGRGVA